MKIIDGVIGVFQSPALSGAGWGFLVSFVNVWGVDWVLGFALVSVVFTAFAVGGVANSVSIIDGFNPGFYWLRLTGLASGRCAAGRRGAGGLRVGLLLAWL